MTTLLYYPSFHYLPQLLSFLNDEVASHEHPTQCLFIHCPLNSYLFIANLGNKFGTSTYWRYGLTKLYRLVYDYPNGFDQFHPIWSILIHEVEWEGRYIELKRFKKTVDQRDPEKTETKNVQFALAHLVALQARNLLDACTTTQSIIEDLESVVTDFIKSLQSITSFYDALMSVYRRRAGRYWWESLIEHVSKLFKKRVLLSHAFC